MSQGLEGGQGVISWPPSLVEAGFEAPRPALGALQDQPWSKQTPGVQGTESPRGVAAGSAATGVPFTRLVSSSPLLGRNELPSEPVGGTVRIVNEWTGESFCRPRGVKPARCVIALRRRMRGFLALAVGLDLDVYFLTLTVQSEKLSDTPRQLHRFVSFLQMRFKRAGFSFIYVWVLEVQMRRLVRTGELARHWHMVIAVPGGTLPNVEYVKSAVLHYQVRSEGSVVTSGELFKRWGQGQVLCKLANSNPRRYLEKYLTKLEGYGLLGSDTKLVGSSYFGSASWPEWTRIPIERWAVLGESEGRRVRLRGRRLELVEPHWIKRKPVTCLYGVDGVCPGGRRCSECSDGHYEDLPGDVVVEWVRSPWHIVPVGDPVVGGVGDGVSSSPL